MHASPNLTSPSLQLLCSILRKQNMHGQTTHLANFFQSFVLFISQSVMPQHLGLWVTNLTHTHTSLTRMTKNGNWSHTALWLRVVSFRLQNMRIQLWMSTFTEGNRKYLYLNTDKFWWVRQVFITQIQSRRLPALLLLSSQQRCTTEIYYWVKTIPKKTLTWNQNSETAIVLSIYLSHQLLFSINKSTLKQAEWLCWVQFGDMFPS